MANEEFDELEEFEEDAWYSDDPNEEKKVSLQSKMKAFVPVVVVLVAAVYFLPSTVGGKINLSSGTNIEYGQGANMAIACSGSTNVTVTPKSFLKNAANGTGTHYLESIRVSNIPSGCGGVDFVLNAYNDSSSTPLALFNSTSTSAVVYNNNGTFQPGAGMSGFSISSGSGSFEITFNDPVAQSSSVFKLTIQSTQHALASCAQGGACSIGDVGPGGGTVFYVSAGAFTETGAPCASTCRYLEAAPNTWYGGSSDPAMQWSADTTTASGVSSASGAQSLGKGYSNTASIIAFNSTPGFAATAARAYRGPKNLTDWFLPSYLEIDQLADYSNARGNVGFQSRYWVSSEQSATRGWVRYFYGVPGYEGGYEPKSNTYYVRPIRAF